MNIIYIEGGMLQFVLVPSNNEAYLSEFERIASQQEYNVKSHF